MKTLLVTTVALAALGATAFATAQEFASPPPNANQIVCYDPLYGNAHSNPAECARFVGKNLPEDMGGPQDFRGPGIAARFFTGDAQGKNRVTPAKIFSERCVHGDDLPPETP